jgi:hypothetical protein
MAPYLAALLLVVLSLLLGAALCRACAAPIALAPVAGLALLIALATAAVQLPGRATTAAIVVGAATVAAAVSLARSRLRPARTLTVGALLAGAGAAAVTALPFLSAGQVGIPGVSLNNDTAVHLLWTDGLRSALTERLYPANPGYPLGPHSLFATLAQGTGFDAADALVGLLIATVVLFAMTAVGVLRGVPLVLRVPAAVFAAMPYLTAAWFAQGAFKEPLLALLLLGFALAVEGVLAPGAPLRRWSLIPAGVIAAACLLIYSYLAVAWLGVAAVGVVVLTALARRPRLVDLARSARAAAIPLVVGVGAALLAAAVELPRLVRYLGAVGTSPAAGDGGIGAAELGNLAGPLRRTEALPVWPTGDFRFPPPPDAFLYHELKWLMVVALIGGALFLLARRRDAALLGASAAALVVWWLSDRGQSPYVTAKALVVLSPFVALVIVRALLPETLPAAWAGRGAWALRVAIAAAIVVAGFGSTQLVLRSSPVESSAQREQLDTLRPLVADGPTLFIGQDDYAPVRLNRMALGYVASGFPPSIGVATRAEKPFQYGNALDWDSFSAETLDRFRYVVAVRSPYASTPPPNFRLLDATPLYAAWERTGPTAPRETIESSDTPAGVLRCEGSARARAIARTPGVAAVERRAPAQLAGGLPPLGVGGATSIEVRLPKGLWRLAMKYTSPMPIRLAFDDVRLPQAPANTTRPGAWWPVGSWKSDGRAHTLLVVGERQSRLSATAFPASVSGIVAVPPGGDELIPLRQACGRLVDWYRAG